MPGEPPTLPWTILRQPKVYIVESVTFEDSVRKAFVHAVKAAFTGIGVKRLSSYFNLEGALSSIHPNQRLKSNPSQGLHLRCPPRNWVGPSRTRSSWFLSTQITRYNQRSFTSPSPFPRAFPSIYPRFLSGDPAELLKIITHTTGVAQPFDFHACTTPCR